MAENVRGSSTPLDTYCKVETSRKKRALGLMIPTLLGSAALLAGRVSSVDAAPPSSNAASQVTHPLEYVGFTDGNVWIPDTQQAITDGQQMASAGAKVLRIFEPYSPGQANIVPNKNTTADDYQRLCSAAEAALLNNLTLEVVYLGYSHDAKVGFMPNDATTVQQFLTAGNNVLWALAGPNANMVNPDGSQCVTQPLKNIIIEPFNEVNDEYFNNNQDIAGKAAYIMARAYQAFKADAARINQALAALPASGTVDNSPLNLKIAGEALSSSHDPIGFQAAFDAALKRLGFNYLPMDMLAIHPYPTSLSDTPANEESILGPGLENQVQSDFGQAISEFFDEEGVNAKPSDPYYLGLYSKKTLAFARVNIDTQAEQYQEALKVAAELPYAVGVLFFKYRDNGKDCWLTGIVYPNGDHKASWEAVRDANNSAVNNSWPTN